MSNKVLFECDERLMLLEYLKFVDVRKKTLKGRLKLE